MATIGEKLASFYDMLDDDERAALDALGASGDAVALPPQLRTRLGELAGGFSPDDRRALVSASASPDDLGGDVEGFTFAPRDRHGARVVLRALIDTDVVDTDLEV
jgi:hypothetical protein